VDCAVAENGNGVEGSMSARHDNRDAATHRLTHADAGSDVDRWITGHDVTVTQPTRDLPDGSVIRSRDILDPQFVADLWRAVTDSEVINADEHQAVRNVVLGLAVSRVPWKPHVVVTTRITTARHGEHHRLPIREPVRRR